MQCSPGRCHELAYLVGKSGWCNGKMNNMNRKPRFTISLISYHPTIRAYHGQIPYRFPEKTRLGKMLELEMLKDNWMHSQQCRDIVDIASLLKNHSNMDRWETDSHFMRDNLTLNKPEVDVSSSLKDWLFFLMEPNLTLTPRENPSWWCCWKCFKYHLVI